MNVNNEKATEALIQIYTLKITYCTRHMPDKHDRIWNECRVIELIKKNQNFDASE